MSQLFFVCCTGFDREFFGSGPSSLDRPLMHAVTFTDLAAFVKNILSCPASLSSSFGSRYCSGCEMRFSRVFRSAVPQGRLSA